LQKLTSAIDFLSKNVFELTPDLFKLRQSAKIGKFFPSETEIAARRSHQAADPESAPKKVQDNSI
jgi:hypothetical protein